MRWALIIAGLLAAILAAWLLRSQTSDVGSGPAPELGDAVPVDAPDPDGPGLAGRDPLPPPAQESRQVSPPEETPLLAAGLVVDESHRPLAGAEVIATIEGVETDRAHTSAEGTFEVALLPRPRLRRSGRMTIRSGHRGADYGLSVSPDSKERLDYGRIVLSAMHDVTVRVVRGGAPVSGATVVVGQARARGGAAFPSRTTGTDGLARFEHVLGPDVSAFAVAPGTGRGHVSIALPPKGVVDVELPDDRVATIRVMHGVTQTPIGGAEVFVGGGGTLAPPAGPGCLPPHPDLRTGKDGVVTASGLPAGYVWVTARADGLAMKNHGLMLERVILQPDATDITVTLWPYRAVRFPIKETGVGAPPEGTQMTLRRYQPLPGYDVGHPEARIESAHLVLEPFPPGFDVGHVVTADGRWAQWQTPMEGDVGKAVEFRRIYDVHVRLLWRDGTPAADQVLNALRRPRGGSATLRTDADGRTHLPQCVAETVTFLWTPTEGGFGMPIGSVGLVTDPGEVSFTIDRPIEIVLRVRNAGQPGIPKGLEVRVPDLDPDRPVGGDRDITRSLREDWAAGELRLRWLPMPDGSAPPITLRADGIPPVTVTPRKGDDGLWRAEVELAAGATLKVRVQPPEGGRYWLRVDQWDEAQGSWRYLHDHHGYQAGRSAVDGVHTMPGFSRGRYRLVEGWSGLTSKAIEISGAGEVEVDFDASAVLLVQGKVVVPDGEDPAYASFYIEGRAEGQSSRNNPGRVQAQGTFELRAIRGERVALVAQHPLLRAVAPTTSFIVGTEAPVIHFRSGPHLVFDVVGSDLTTAPPDPSSYPPWWSPVHVRIQQPGAWNSEGQAYMTIAKDGRFRCEVPATGTYTVRIEQGGVVPILLEDVKIGAGPTNLGELTFLAGATLTVRLLAGEGGLPQRVNVQATRMGERPYSCWGSQVQAGEPPSVAIKGLGPGRFQIVVRRLWASGDTIGEAVVESDGHTPLTVDVKLR